MDGALEGEAFDFVVIGAGSTGSVLASRLAAGGARVLVLEAGGTDRRPDVLVPALVSSIYQRANWMYPVEPDLTRTAEPDSWMAGRLVGGSGSINACVFVRGNRADFDGWAKLGCTGWDYDSVLPAFKRMETWSMGADDYRGGDGPIHVEPQSDRGEANLAFVEAAVQAGYDAVDDYNGHAQEGVALTQVNQRRGTRSHASREYLRRAPRRLTLRTRASVRRVLFEADRAVGVEYVHRGRLRVARAGEEVILSAGALGSPKILQLSGVGPANELRRFGIPTVSDCPGVGANLQEHALLPQRWHANIRTLNNVTAPAALRAAFDYAVHGTGLLAMTMVQVHVIAGTDGALGAPDLQMQFQPFITERRVDRHGATTVRRAKENGFQPASTLLHPHTRGRVGLRSPNPADPPRIDYRFLDDEDDLRRIIAGARELRRVMEQPAMARLTGPQYEPEGSCRDDDEWREYARRYVRGLQHSAGTCKMGVDDMAVVDPELRVRGVGGLRVADASIMPVITTGNTNAPAMMIGERAAELILARRAT